MTKSTNTYTKEEFIKFADIIKPRKWAEIENEKYETLRKQYEEMTDCKLRDALNDALRIESLEKKVAILENQISKIISWMAKGKV